MFTYKPNRRKRGYLGPYGLEPNNLHIKTLGFPYAGGNTVERSKLDVSWCNTSSNYFSLKPITSNIISVVQSSTLSLEPVIWSAGKSSISFLLHHAKAYSHNSSSMTVALERWYGLRPILASENPLILEMMSLSLHESYACRWLGSSLGIPCEIMVYFPLHLMSITTQDSH